VIDPIKFMVARVREIPDLPAGVVVNADLDLAVPGTPRVDVVLEGGPGRIIKHRLDSASFTLNSYGPDKQSASRLSFIVREWILEEMPGSAWLDQHVAVNDTSELEYPADASDLATREQRFIHRVTIQLYEF
jgi:hypothetical protein